MFDVSIRKPMKSHIDEIAFNASLCYQPTVEKAEAESEKIPVISALYKPGHVTTMQHAESYMKFILDGIPVSMATFGLHLTHQFYNSSQRSGRYCIKMFDQDYQNYIAEFVELAFCEPATEQYIRNRSAGAGYDINETTQDIIDWVESGVNFFKANIDRTIEMATTAIIKERPHYGGDSKLLAKRIAQEQLRNYISTIFPTGLAYTVNLTTLIAMYQSAWNVPYKALLGRMISEASVKFPILAQIPDLGVSELDSWVPEFQYTTFKGASTFPNVTMKCSNDSNQMSAEDWREFTDLHDSSLDRLNFHPKAFHQKYDKSIISTVEHSVAAFGQDQRHRTIERTSPIVTGQFRQPLLLDADEDAIRFSGDFMTGYLQLCEKYGNAMMMYFIPYGAVVKYQRKASLRAWYHCQSKRLCNNAQAEITLSEKALNNLVCGKHPFLKRGFDNVSQKPAEPCVHGKCPEGKRYCGRDLKNKTDRRFI